MTIITETNTSERSCGWNKNDQESWRWRTTNPRSKLAVFKLQNKIATQKTWDWHWTGWAIDKASGRSDWGREGCNKIMLFWKWWDLNSEQFFKIRLRFSLAYFLFLHFTYSLSLTNKGKIKIRQLQLQPLDHSCSSLIHTFEYQPLKLKLCMTKKRQT